MIPPKRFWAFLALGFFLNFSVALPTQGYGAVLSIGPAAGSFVVDSTFDVSVFLDTGGQAVNAIELKLNFPPDKLQLISSSTGKSIIGIWASLPKFNNTNGTVELTGGVPDGIIVSKGLVTTLTFRAKAVGRAVVKISNSRVLLNDGGGTEIESQINNALYNLVLPPPTGPIVVSDTHPDQSKWNKNRNVSLQWGEEAGIVGFSYMISDLPVDTPDDISEGALHAVSYKDLSDGRHYFHIKGLRAGQWGGITHYALNVDASPPAEFKIEIIPSNRTSRQQPVIQFGTTDAMSGIERYELKLISLGPKPLSDSENQSFFIEAQSPYIPSVLEFGKYDIILRAFDNAGNIREVSEHLAISEGIWRFVADRGLELPNGFIILWWALWILFGLLILLLLYIFYRIRKWHRHLNEQKKLGLPQDLVAQVDELQRYRAKYGKLAVTILLIGSLWFVSKTRAGETVLPPPLITTVSRHITNEEIFYVGGKAPVQNGQVLIYVQNVETAATIKEVTVTDKNGEWFYRHDSFLPSGQYVLWSQTQIGEQQSPPSPQIEMTVETTAFQLGSNRLSFTMVNLLVIFVLGLGLVILAVYTLGHYLRVKKKHQLFLKEIAEAEASIRRGFAVLNRDIQAELEVIKKAKLGPDFSEEEQRREQQILKDLREIEQYIDKEIWEIEKYQ